jgi:FKBP-type peptidyl-prolyl cis-trans isomerase
VWHTVQPNSDIMKSRLAITAAAAVCLLGCNKPAQTTGDSPAATNAPTAAPSASAATPTASATAPGAPLNETKTTASGLKYTVLKRGTGAVSPKATDTVKVHYHGTLLDGTVFDSSVERGQPISFPLNGVIPGWTEGLQLMKVGGKSHLVCPAKIAYGDRGAPPKIKPGATLQFDVELLGIEAPPPPPPAAETPVAPSEPVKK